MKTIIPTNQKGVATILNRRTIAIVFTAVVLFCVLRVTYRIEAETQEVAVLAAQEEALIDEADVDDVLTESKVMPLWGESTLPVLYITLEEDEALTEKEFSDATLTLTYPDSMLPTDDEEDADDAIAADAQAEEETLTINDASLDIEVRYRGNSTYDYEKKPYKIKLETAADLLRATLDETAESAATDWVLLANAVDESNLRNYYMYLAAAQLDGLEYVPEGIFVEVYFGDEYRGVFLLCEEIEVDDARLDIDDELFVDNAMLLEMRMGQKQEYGFALTYQDETKRYDVRSEVLSERQVVRARDAVEAMYEAIASGDQEAVAATMDLDSCVDMYLLQEFTMNVDVNYGSFYIYLKENDDTVYFGPPWDFDRSLGYFEVSDMLFCANIEHDFGAGGMQMYYDLMQLDWFQDLVRERWNEKKDIFLETIGSVLGLEAQYQEAFLKNYEYWFVDEGQTEAEWKAEYEAQYTYLYYWTASRYTWMDNYFNNVM